MPASAPFRRRFTPEVLISAGRRSSGLPNSTGKLILYSVSEHSFEKRKKTISVYLLTVSSLESRLIGRHDSFSDPAWITDSEFVFFTAKEDGQTRVMVQDTTCKKDTRSPSAAPRPGRRDTVPDPELRSATPVEVRVINGALANVRVSRLAADDEHDGRIRVAFVCSAPARPDGTMVPATGGPPKPRSSARIYTSLFARHWDTWSSDESAALWYGVLERRSSGGGSGGGAGAGRADWSLAGGGDLINLLAGTSLSCPVAPFGGTGDFDVSARGIAFVAKDPDLNPALYTKTDLYYCALPSFSEPRTAPPRLVRTGRLQGYSVSPAFSPDGGRIAFARMASRQYESDKSHLLLVPDVDDLAAVQEFYQTDDGVGSWDRRPDEVIWSLDGSELYLTSEHEGKVALWRVPSDPVAASAAPPEIIFLDGTVSDARPLGSGGLVLVSSSSLTESSCFSTVDPARGPSSRRVLSSGSGNGAELGLSPAQRRGADFWFPGAAGYNVHALAVRPSGFDADRRGRARYPLAMMIHGGPQNAWLDSWSTRWNPAVFAEQGYFTVMPNFTGSSGYGQRHCDAIAGQWGGLPYDDIVRCLDHIAATMPYVDVDRAVALGASYGGYMINWIQGHELGRRFRALVCHDGIYSTQNQWSTDELFFPIHDFGGLPWEKPDGYSRWDPARHVGQWATPQLTIHSELDYRVPVAEGLAAFNALQARGVPSKLVVFPDENHWVLKPENSLVWHREVLAWINRYSGVDGDDKDEGAGGKGGGGDTESAGKRRDIPAR